MTDHRRHIIATSHNILLSANICWQQGNKIYIFKQMADDLKMQRLNPGSEGLIVKELLLDGYYFINKNY